MSGETAEERSKSQMDRSSLCGKASERHLPRITTRQMLSRQRAIIRVSSRVSKLDFPCIPWNPRAFHADNGITSFANILVRPLSSSLSVLMQHGQSNQRGSAFTIHRFQILIFKVCFENIFCADSRRYSGGSFVNTTLYLHIVNH